MAVLPDADLEGGNDPVKSRPGSGPSLHDQPGASENREAFERIFRTIADEYELTRSLVLDTGQTRLLGADQALQLSVDLRNRTIVPLGFLQVALLKRLRDQNRQPPMSEALGVEEDRRTYSRSELLRGALLTINGIAAGMRNTG